MYNVDKIDELVRLVNDLRYINLNEATIVKYINELKSLRNLSYEFKTNDFNDKFQNKLIEQGVPTLKWFYDELIKLSSKVDNYKIWVEFDGYVCPIIGVCPYRAYYKSVAIEYYHQQFLLDNDEYRKKIAFFSGVLSIKNLRLEINSLLQGETLEGNMGEYYKFGNTTPVYVSTDSESLDIIPVGFTIDKNLEIVLIDINFFANDDNVA